MKGKHIPGNRLAFAALFLVALALTVPAVAGAGTWTTNGPFATGSGDRVIYALAVSPDGLVYCGTGSGSVFSFTLTGDWAGAGPGGADSGDDGRRASYSASSPGAGAGTTMYFRIDEPVTDRVPFAIISVTIVPDEDLGETVMVVTDSYSAGTDEIDGRKTAGLFSIVLTGVNPGKVGHAEIAFAVSKSWLEKYGLSPEDVVLLHNVNGEWVECPTTYGYESGGICYFTATTAGFSYFAIAGRADGSTGTGASPVATGVAPGNTAGQAGDSATVDDPPASPSARISASRPAGEPTTAAPADPAVPDGRPGFPFLTAALIGAGCIAFTGGAWWVRRWLIRRQNPTLFMDYDK